MMRLRTVTRIAAGLPVLLALGLWGCSSDLSKSNGGEVLLEITQIQAQSENGGTAGTLTSTLQSDVLFKGSVFNDNAVIGFQAFFKNPTLVTNSALLGVYLDSYAVTYTRTDGQNTQGVDVPYAISGPMAGLVIPGGPVVTDAIIVVRHQAKLEPPLSLLDGLGSQQIITCIANITVSAHTLSGQTVQANGSLEIVFADFADSGS
jgi:hypothetical protein